MSTQQQIHLKVQACQPEPSETCDSCHMRALVAVHTRGNLRLTFCGHHWDGLVRNGLANQFVAVCDTRVS